MTDLPETLHQAAQKILTEVSGVESTKAITSTMLEIGSLLLSRLEIISDQLEKLLKRED